MRSADRVHEAFLVTVILKGAGAVLEIASAGFVALVSPHAVARLVFAITGPELAHHPADVVARYLRHAAETYSIDARTFAALYLLSHGVIKLALVVPLLRGRMWAYPASIAAFGAFIAYQLYRYSFTHSLMLLVLTVFDVVVIVLVWLEWRRRLAAPAGDAGGQASTPFPGG